MGELQLMEILVTGALGVNGSAVLRNFCARQIRPIVFENRIDLSLVQDLVGQFEVIQGDINDLVALIRVLQKHKIQRLVHMAALMPPAAEADPYKGFIVNALGTVNVLEAASLTGVERVVFTSSVSYYGRVTEPENLHPVYTPVTEDHYPNPDSVYDVTKVASEVMGLAYGRTYGIEFVSLRFANIYGPGKLARHGRVSLHSKIIESAMAGVPVRLRQGSEQKADMIYVDDVAQGIVLATLVDRVPHPAYNISTGRGETIVEFADAVKAVIPGANIEVGPGLDFFEYGAPGGYYLMDPTLARENLGFEAQCSLEEGVRRYVETMRRLDLHPTAAD
jgi:UDP-glucose 4-epimerase